MIVLTGKNTETASSVTNADSPTTAHQVSVVVQVVHKVAVHSVAPVVVKANATTGPTTVTANSVTNANSPTMAHHLKVAKVDPEWVVVVVVVLAVNSPRLVTALTVTLASSLTAVTLLQLKATLMAATPVAVKENATTLLKPEAVNSVTHADLPTETKCRRFCASYDNGDALRRTSAGWGYTKRFESEKRNSRA